MVHSDNGIWISVSIGEVYGGTGSDRYRLLIFDCALLFLLAPAHRRYFLESPSITIEQAPPQTQPFVDGAATSRATHDVGRLASQAEAIAAEIRKRQQRKPQGMLQAVSPFQGVFNTLSPSKSAPSEAAFTPPQQRKNLDALEGVPSIRGWKVRVDGGISGIIYGSPSAEDGDYIETSCICSGSIENGSVVETTSGSRYFLSAERADTAHSIVNAFKGFAPGRQGGTITITKQGVDEQKKQRNRQNAQFAMGVLEKSLPRATFSLLDLFGGGDKEEVKGRTSKQPPLAPVDKAPPEGVPTLSDWSCNDDGTVTGVIFGSQNIDDGNLVTTSRIVEGERKQYEIVTTVSGSLYFLC